MSAISLSDQSLLQLAYSHARRIGLAREDAQDCAQEFRVHLLRTALPSAPSSSWLHRCAHNYACNYLRGLIRRRSTEQRYREHVTGAPQGGSVTMIRIPGPRTLTLRKVFWEQLVATLRQFTPEQRSLFTRHHLRQHSLAAIAAETGRTVHALQQSLYHLHRRLAKLLLEQGWNVADVRQLFGASLPLASPANEISKNSLCSA